MEITSKQHLPALIPDLVVSPGQHGEWLVDSCSSELENLAGLGRVAIEGQPVSKVMPEAVPALDYLCSEVASRKSSLSGVLFRPSRRATRYYLLEISPWGEVEVESVQRVAFFFRAADEADLLRESPVAGLVGRGPAMREVFRKISRYAGSDAPVVITGETGTGKELVAAALHERSRRSAGPYVSLNCAAVNEQLLESELFGHERGSFTGAHRTHRGRFERADGGTLFLDEIGDMPLALQAKLLRVLETGILERVGSEQQKRIDVRILCATHRNLEREIAAGRFRADLYHRLAVLSIAMPPLRDRREDLPLLVAHFLEQFNRTYGRYIQRLTPEAIALLQAYNWPGNVRELRNVLERVYVETQAEVVGARDFQSWVGERQRAAGELKSAYAAPLASTWPGENRYHERSTPDLLEAELLSGHHDVASRSTRPVDLDADEIRNAFHAAAGNISAAARLLGVHRATLYRYMRKLGLKREEL